MKIGKFLITAILIAGSCTTAFGYDVSVTVPEVSISGTIDKDIDLSDFEDEITNQLTGNEFVENCRFPNYIDSKSQIILCDELISSRPRRAA